MIYNGLLLKCIQSISDERTIYATYHLLKGKKSIQTLHDARLYKLENYYGIYPTLRKGNFDRSIKELINGEFISNIKDDYYVVSELGKAWLLKQEPFIPFHYFVGFHTTDPLFLNRLLLLIQTYTNINNGNFSFIPITDRQEVTNRIKRLYRTSNWQEQKVLTILYDELSFLLKMFKDEEANLFVDHLTGYKHYGMSLDQLARKYNYSMEDVHILLTGISQKMQQAILNRISHFKILPTIMEQKDKTDLMTRTAQRTNQLLKQGYTIKQIASIRGLKENTIQDHLVEIALHKNDFPLEDYVQNQEQQIIEAAIEQVDSFKLKSIKAVIPIEIDYFQIRLVLACREKGEVNV